MSGEGLPAVRVRLLIATEEGTETVVWQGATDESGSFLSEPVPAGLLQLRVEALAFEPVSEALDLRGRREVEVRVEMVPQAVELEAVVVTSPSRSRLEESGFYERRRAGGGHSFTRKEIQARRPTQVSDLLRTIPGMQVTPGRGAAGATLRYRGSCQPDLVIDGVAVSPPFFIDELLSVGDLEALEVYSTAYQPAQIRGSSCGTVLAWTREGSPTEGSRLTWRRGLAVASVAILSFLLVR